MSDDVKVIEDALRGAHSTRRPEAFAALRTLERELIANERAANDLFLENEGLRARLGIFEAALRDIVEDVHEGTGLTSDEMRHRALLALTPGEVSA